MYRDKNYLKWLSEQPCFLTWRLGCVPAHISTAGKGLKSHDWEALPILDEVHREGHQKGEATTWGNLLITNKTALRDALRAVGGMYNLMYYTDSETVGEIMEKFHEDALFKCK
jgi:hypothetical protein